MDNRAVLIIVLALASWSCATTSSGNDDCETSADCDDGVDCTFDSCEAGECEHRPEDALCEDGETCDAESGCVGGGCTDDDDCDDGIECTLDLCESTGSCTWRAMDELCGEGQECREGTGCVDAGCTGDDDCADPWDCTVDVCGDDGICLHLPDNSRCEDGETCREDSGCQTIDCDVDDDCQDGIFCNGRETCHPEFGCMPAEEAEDCDDNEECTIDRCDTETDQCVYSVNTEIPDCDTFDPEHHLNGCFEITPSVSQHCGMGSVNYNFNQVCFELTGPVLTIQAGPYELVQTPAPSDANFSASHQVSGDCTETYTLTGTFSGSGTFSATWTSGFTPPGSFSCLLGGCANLTIPVTGTRL